MVDHVRKTGGLSLSRSERSTLVAVALVPIVLLLTLMSNALRANLFPAIVLVALAAVTRMTQKTWLAPGAFFALVWCSYVWMGLLIAWDVEVWQGAVWWIVACVLAVNVGTLLGTALGHQGRSVSGERSPAFQLRGLALLTPLLSLIGFGAAAALILSTGRSVGSVFSLEALSQLGSELSGYRYSFAITGYTEPLAERIFLVAIYLAALLAGTLLATQPLRSRRSLTFLVLLPAVAVALVDTTKASIFFTVVLLTASYLAGRAAVSSGHVALFTWLRGFVAALICLGAAVISVVIQMLRYGYTDFEQAIQVLSTLRLDFFGYLGVFSDWFMRGGWKQDQLGWGAYSFAGLFQSLGLQARNPGVFSGSVVYIGPQLSPSNIFTIFRILIDDFGAAGSLVALLVVGIAAGMAFATIRSNRVIPISVLSAFYATTLFSHTVNLFAYNTILLAWVLFTAYLLVAHSDHASTPNPGGAVREIGFSQG